MNEQLPEIITTERLVLRPWRIDDVAAVAAYADDREWGRFLPVPFPYPRAEAERFVARQILLPRDQHASWAITRDGEPSGGINIRFFHEGRIGEFGYSVARRQWGRGLATEAARAVIEAAFANFGRLVRVRAMADTRNLASRRVLEKLGMRHEGTLRRNRFVREEPADEAWYGLLRDELPA